MLTCPGTACFAGLDGEERIKLGAAIRYFGDGWQISKMLGARRYWRIPVMDGEFVCEETTGLTKEAVGGGNLLIMGRDRLSTLAAAEAAVAAISAVPDVIMPFPGGIVRSGSKVGSKYKALTASTNDAYCPTLKGRVSSALTPDVGSVLEIVIDGLTDAAVRAGMAAGLQARLRARRGVGRGARQRRQLRRQARKIPLPARRAARMSALVLTLKEQPPQRCDLSPLTPERLAADAGAIERLDIRTTRRPLSRRRHLRRHAGRSCGHRHRGRVGAVRQARRRDERRAASA